MKILRTGLLAKKIGMTKIFTKEGNALPVTVVQTGPCTVIQKKTDAHEGYSALQLGFDEVSEKSTTKPLKGHFAKAKSPNFRFLREIRVSPEELEKYEVGQVLTVDFFKEGELIDVTGTSKGKGYAGVVKRHHFSGFPGAHGTHEVFRHGGSIGQAASPGRVFKGLRMAGRLGATRSTVQNLKVARVIKDKNLLLIKGAVAGASGGYLIIRKALKKPCST
jgi:large subunit ribosomal protein L3